MFISAKVGIVQVIIFTSRCNFAGDAAWNRSGTHFPAASLAKLHLAMPLPLGVYETSKNQSISLQNVNTAADARSEQASTLLVPS